MIIRSQSLLLLLSQLLLITSTTAFRSVPHILKSPSSSTLPSQSSSFPRLASNPSHTLVLPRAASTTSTSQRLRGFLSGVAQSSTQQPASYTCVRASQTPAEPERQSSAPLVEEKGAASKEKGTSLPIKQLVLALLVIQNAAQMLSMRYSRVTLSASAVKYLPSTAVVAAEALKVVTCLVILLVQHKKSTPKLLWSEVILNWRDTLKVAVPAFVYMIQNNLLYVATSHLDAATCQITYQLKILTTAMFAVGMLGKKIPPVKWVSLVILVAGIALVQLPQMAAKAAATTAVGNPAIGLAAVVGACVLSGFAGIWFEKILKGSNTSIWVRNVQLGVIGGILGLIGAFWKDGAAIQAAGFFQGYNGLVWSVVCQVGCGGLLVALVVRYADNILKGFATSLSIIASGIFSMYFIPSLKFTPTPVWFTGTALVLLATFIYSLPDNNNTPKPPARLPTPPKET